MFQMSVHAHVDELVKMKIAFVYTLYKKNSYFFRGTKMKINLLRHKVYLRFS